MRAMAMKLLNPVATILGLLWLAGCGGGGKGPGSEVNRWLGLKIDRPEIEVRHVFENEFGEPDENGLITNTYCVHPAAMSVPMIPEKIEDSFSTGTAPDPFAAPEQSEFDIRMPRKIDPKRALEFFGVEFGPGSDATFDRKSCVLQITQTPDQMDLVEAVLQGGCNLGHGDRSGVIVRVEIFELRAGDVLELERSEELKVEFPEGTEAVYDAESGTLSFRHQPEWVDFAEAILDASKPEVRTVNVLLEIYEIPTALALRLEQSASEHADHRPEWEALQKLVRDGEGECSFVTSCSVRSRSGERARYQDGSEHLAFADFERDGGEESPTGLKPRFDTRVVGTIFELDTVLGPDDRTIALNFSIEHHTAPPTMTPVEVPLPGEAKTVPVETPEYHAKTLTTQTTMMSGETRLLCSWQLTGSPEYEGRDAMRIVFLKTDVQELRFEYGRDGY